MRLPTESQCIGKRRRTREETLAILARRGLCSFCNGAVFPMKKERDKECRICRKGFQSLDWGPFEGRKRETQICWTCAQNQNLCRNCLVDIDYGVVPEHLQDPSSSATADPSSSATAAPRSPVPSNTY